MALLTADDPGLGGVFGVGRWGIFGRDGSPILAVDSVGDVDYSRDYAISDYPQEQGAFASYNKVQTPFQAKIGFYISTSRIQFLNAVEAAVQSLNLVTVVTPEIRYASANLKHYNYRRDARNGAKLIRVEIWCEQVRVIVGEPPTNPQSTNAAKPSQSGQVQPTTTTQTAPAASNTGVGGGFVADSPNKYPGFVTKDGLPTLPTDRFGPGIPNSTGGGESAGNLPLGVGVGAPLYGSHKLDNAINGAAVFGGI